MTQWIRNNYKKTWFILASTVLVMLAFYAYDQVRSVNDVLTYTCGQYNQQYESFEGLANDELDSPAMVATLNYTRNRFGELNNDTLAKGVFEYYAFCKNRPNYSLLDMKTMMDKMKSMPKLAEVFVKFDALYEQDNFVMPTKNQAIANYITMHADVSN